MTEWIVGVINDLGYVGLFLLMLLESVFPPIPSEFIVPFAGFAAARGDMNLVGVVLATTSGSIAGMMPWYFLGRMFGMDRICNLADRFGRWFTIDAEEVRKATGYFDRFGPVIVLVGRLVPIIRTLISIPAGLARMNLVMFLLASAFGSAVWNLILILAGYLLQENYEAIGAFVDPLTIVVLVAVVVLYLYRLVSWRPKTP